MTAGMATMSCSSAPISRQHNEIPMSSFSSILFVDRT